MRAAALIAAAVTFAAPCSADDRYLTQPDIESGWCPGGHSVDRVGLERCDGIDFPGGKFWHLERTQVGKTFRMCITHEHDKFGTPQPAEGCGYAL